MSCYRRQTTVVFLQFPADGLFLSADKVRINAGPGNQLFVLALLHDTP